MIQLNDREWGIFQIDKIFDIYPGKRLTKADMVTGKLPFIGATENNNGITEWVANVNDSLDSKVFGVNYNGSVVETFYHPYSCIFSDDVKRLHLKEKAYDGNRYIMLFIKTAILKQKIKYAYGYKFNENRMKKQFITLPVTDDNQPDWQFMEDYMRQQEIAILQPITERLHNQLKMSELGGG